MKPIAFPGQNVVFGENQPQYQPLPALALNDKNGEVITCWQLTDEELEVVMKTRCVYLSQYTFNLSLQPVLITADLSDKFEIIP